ncbi:MAG: hypothetical protein ABGZ49_05755 [Akkermansiaceae bacterium]|jgi:hypothetical protein
MKVLTLSLAIALSSSATVPQPRQVIRPVEKAPISAVTAVLSGVDANEVYEELPPVLVELSNLPRRAAVWVEVKKGSSGGALRGVTVKSEIFLRRGGEAVLNVPGVESRCDSAGTWTVSVLVSDGEITTALAHTTFAMRPR